MKKTNAEHWLCRAQPLMAVGLRAEFQQRLQWLSKGVLSEHILNERHSLLAAREKADYRMFHFLRSYEEACKALDKV
jgi:hypothetical protein